MKSMRDLLNIMSSTDTQDLNEAWVIKSKDGIEKRFKDANSVEAKEWQQTIAKKPKKERAKFSHAWWLDKDADFDFTGVLPWATIGTTEVAELVNRERNNPSSQFIPEGYDHWVPVGNLMTKVDDIPVAIKVIDLVYKVTPEDDLGVDDTVTDVVRLNVCRDTTNPEILKFSFN